MARPPIEAVDLRLRRRHLAITVSAASPSTRSCSASPPGTLSNLLGYGLDVAEPGDGEEYTNKFHLLEIGAIEMPEYTAWVHDRSAAVFGRPIDIGSRMNGGFDSMSIHWMVLHKVRELRDRGYRTAICTNNIAAFRPTWHQQFPLDWFDEVIDSSEVGLRKPEPAIYLMTAERLGVAPECCVFLDDHPGNVVGAEAVGMTGVLVGEDPWDALDDLDVRAHSVCAQRRRSKRTRFVTARAANHDVIASHTPTIPSDGQASVATARGTNATR